MSHQTDLSESFQEKRNFWALFLNILVKLKNTELMNFVDLILIFFQPDIMISLVLEFFSIKNSGNRYS